MKVPEIEQSVSLNPTTPEAPRFAAPPEAAFGGQMAEAAARLGRTVEDVGNQLAGHVAERWQMEKEQRAMDAYTNYGKGAQALAHDMDPDTGEPARDPETGKPRGLLDRSLGEARGITVEFDKKQADLMKANMANLQTPSEKAIYLRMATSHAAAMRESVIQHEAHQGNQAYEQSIAAGLGQISESAVNITDPALLDKAVKNALTINTAALSHRGVTNPDVANLHNQTVAASVVEKPINQQLANGGWKVAQQLLEATKGHLAPDAVAELQTRISGKAFDDTQNSVWHTLQGDSSLRMMDGKTFDEAKARDLIMDPEKLPLPDPVTGKPIETKQREKIADFVKSMAGDEAIQRHKQELAGDTAFSNDALSAFKEGATYDQALKMAANPKYGAEASSVLAREGFVKRMFSEADVKSDPAALMAIHDGLNTGMITKTEDIYKAFQDGNISKHDAVNLVNLLQKGETAPMKDEWANIKSDLKTKLPDEASRQRFASSLLQQQFEKKITDRSDLQKLYQDNLKTAPTGAPGFFRVLGGQTKAYYKTAEAIQQNQEFVKAVGGTDAAVTLAQRLGGPEVLGPGMPKALAVMALIKRGVDPRRIIAPSIEDVINNHPDWIGSQSKQGK